MTSASEAFMDEEKIAQDAWNTCDPDNGIGDVLSEQTLTLHGKPLKIQVRPFNIAASLGAEMAMNQMMRDFFGIFFTYIDDSGAQVTRLFRTVAAPSKYRQVFLQGSARQKAKVQREAEILEAIADESSELRKQQRNDEIPPVAKTLANAKPVQITPIERSLLSRYEYIESTEGGWTIARVTRDIIADACKRITEVNINTTIGEADKAKQKDAIIHEANVMNAMILKKALDVLQRYNALGYIHGHAHPDNFTIDANGITLVDFSAAFNESIESSVRDKVFEGFPEEFVFGFYLFLRHPDIAIQFGITPPDPQSLKTHAERFDRHMRKEGITDKKELAAKCYEEFPQVLQLQNNIEATLTGVPEAQLQLLMAKIDTIILRHMIREMYSYNRSKESHAMYMHDTSDASLATIFAAIHEALLEAPTIVYPTKTSFTNEHTEVA